MKRFFQETSGSEEQEKEVGHIGDVNWPEHGGGPVFVDADGNARLEYVEPPTDDIEFNEPDARWTVYRVDLDPEPPSWGDVKDVAKSAGISSKELRDYFTSDDPIQRALGYETWAGYYGWAEFDQYALQLTCAEMNERYDADLDCAPPEEEEDNEEEEEEEDVPEADAKDILEGLGQYLEHEGHDATKESARIARMIAGASDTDKIDRILEEVSELTGGHGIESITGDYHVNNYYSDIVALYVNMGDTYNTTLLYETEEDKFLVTSFGDWVEHNERKYGIS